MRLSTNIHEAQIDGNLSRLAPCLDRIRKCGMEGAEVALGGLDVLVGGRLVLPRLEEVRQILSASGLEISVHAPDALDLMADDDPSLHRDVLHGCLEFCARTGVRTMVLHPGRWVNENDFGVKKRFCPGPEETRLRMEEEAVLLRQAADAFPEVTIALENARPYRPYSPYCYAEFPWQLAEQVERVARSNVRACLDTGHLHMASRLHGFDPVDGVRRLGHRIVHIHLHDNFGRTGNWSEKTQTQLVPFGKGDLHMPPGMGNIDFGSLLDVLPDFEGLAVCELRGRYLPDLERHLAAFRALVRHVRQETPTAFLA